MFSRAKGAVRWRAWVCATGRGAIAVLLLALFTLEFLPCVGPCALGEPDPAAPPCLMRLRVCGGADHAPGSLADQSILRSEMPLPLPPSLLWGEAPQVAFSLPEGHPPPVDRPPRLGA